MKQDVVRTMGAGPLSQEWDTMDQASWFQAMRYLARIEAKLMWQIGDGWCYGVERMKYGDGERIAEEIGINYQTAMDAAWVAGCFEFSRRRENLPWSFHKEVAALPSRTADRLLDRCEREGWTRRELRRAIAIHKLSAKHKLIEDGDSQNEISGTFPIIYADPPWTFETFSETGKEISPEQHYPCMGIEEISQLVVDGRPVQEIASNDAVLFLWCTSSNVHLALGVVAAWGFVYKTHLCWDKQRTGTGYVFLNQHELLLYGTKGRMPRPVLVPSSLWSEKRGRHSAKPAGIRDMICQMFPRGRRLELFCRQKIEGWTTWGYEA